MITSVIWAIYHVVKWIHLNKTLKGEGKETVAFWDKGTSVYYKLDQQSKYVLNWGSIWVTIRRFIVNFAIYVFLGLTFIFADKCGIHTGVVTSLFCSSLIFTCIYFFLHHGQKLTKWDFTGILLVVICVILISLSEGKAPEILEGEEDVLEEDLSSDKLMNKILTIFFALCTGLTFSTNSIEMHYSAKTQKVSHTQMNIDGNFLLGVAVLPFFIVEVFILETQEYEMIDLILANANIVCIIIASTGLTAALHCGQAGPVQAIEMMKTVW